jgi:Restriction endonuclease
MSNVPSWAPPRGPHGAEGDRGRCYERCSVVGAATRPARSRGRKGSLLRAMFRRGRRHEARTEPREKGVDEQHPYWLPAHGVEPEGLLVAPRLALLRYDAPPWLTDQKSRQHRPERPPTLSPLRGVSTEEVLEALGAAFSPPELDWELVGVAFVDARPDPRIPAPSPVEVISEEPPWAVEAQEAPSDAPAPPRTPTTFASRKPRKWLREHDDIVAAVRDLSWEGYFSLVADIFRREGYEVFGGEGPDGDVIDMEVVRGAERMLVNCQLRGMRQIGVEPLVEMAQVLRRNEANGVFIITDGDFAPEAWSLADEQAITLIDREILLGLVLDFTLGTRPERTLKTHVRRLLLVLQPGGGERAS